MKNILLIIFAVSAAGISIPLYFLAMMGVGMSPGRPHLALAEAFLLWTPPCICIISSIYLIIIQKTKKWCYFLSVPLIIFSVLESLWTLAILLEG